METKTATINIKDTPSFRYSIGCIICGESVELSELEVAQLEHGHHVHSKVCDKCRMAILYLRNQIE